VPDTYQLGAQASSYRPFSEAGVTGKPRLEHRDRHHPAASTLREIGHVAARAASFPVQPHQPVDVYVVGNREQAQLGGIPAFENEGQLMNTLPGVTAVGGAAGGGLLGGEPSIRGGLSNQIGYQLDGIDATEPLTNYFINNLIIDGARSIDVTAGPGDASKGGSGSASSTSSPRPAPIRQRLRSDRRGHAGLRTQPGVRIRHRLARQALLALRQRPLRSRLRRRNRTAVRQHLRRRERRAARHDRPGAVRIDQRTPSVNGLIHLRQERRQHDPTVGRVGSNPRGRRLRHRSAIPIPTTPANPFVRPIYQQTPSLLGVEQQKYGIPILNPNAPALNTAQSETA